MIPIDCKNKSILIIESKRGCVCTTPLVKDLKSEPVDILLTHEIR